MSHQEIFIGRQRELEAFEQSLEHIRGPRPTFLQRLFGLTPKKAAKTHPLPRIFLFYGEGGFGKTELVHQCMQKAKGFNVIHLDWDDYYKRKNSLPNTSRKMITALFTELTEEKYGISGYFDEYQEIEGQLEKIDKKVERIWQEDLSTITGMLSKGGAAVAGTYGVPIPEKVQDVVSGGLNSLQKEFRRSLLDHIRNNRRMKREEIDLYENNEKALTDTLVRGLEMASRQQPILLTIDTYEQVDEADIEDWMRQYFLDHLLKHTTKVAVIIAGRNDHYRDYRESLPERLVFNRNFNDILFTKEEITDFAKEMSVNLGQNAIASIREHTAGIPLVVKDILTLLRDGKQQDEVLNDLSMFTGTIEEIISSIVTRFLRYTESDSEWNPDRLRCYQMAMLRDFDGALLQKTWKLPARDFSIQMRQLASRHSFLNVRDFRMHDKVQEYLRIHLMQQYEKKGADLPLLKELAAELLEVLKEKLDRIQQALKQLDQRYADDQHNRILTGYLLCLPWVDTRKALQELQSYLIDLLAFEPTVAQELAQEYLSLVPLHSSTDKVTVKKLCTGAIAFRPLTLENSTITPSTTEIEYFRLLRQNLSKDNLEKRALFHFRYAENLIRQGAYQEALQSLQKTFEMSDVFAKAKSVLVVAFASNCFRLGYLCSVYKPNPEFALAAYNLAIILIPDYAVAYNNRGALLYGLSRKEEALNDLNQVINLNPDYAEAYLNRGTLLDDLNRKEEALNDLNQAINLNPDFANAYNNRGILLKKLNRNEEALNDYNQAINLNPDFANAYYNRGNLLYYLNRKEEALNDFNQAINLNPEDADAYFNRGILLKKLNRNEEALNDYNQAINLNPEDADAYFNRGNLLYYLNRKEEAVNDFNQAILLNKKALKNDPENETLKNTLARGYGSLAWHQLFLNQYTEAEQSAQEGLKLAATETWINTNLATAFLFQGKFEAAKALYEQWKDQPFNEEKTFREAFLEDLQEFETAGITHPDVEKVRKLLTEGNK
ncbi:MAG: hypothetical protein DHS20C18_28420 [Saprospiraceae bacterium]|nr:MAG: hypothetical protein DHS20C18_28420 [Saprospiraceae bacterium]